MSAAALLFRHELRLGWRSFRGHFAWLGRWPLLLLLLALAAIMHAAAWRTGALLAGIGQATPAARDAALGPLAPGVTFVLLLMLAQTLSGLTRALYGRGDLDLLLSSPVAPALVLALRAAGVAVGALASAALFAVPVVDAALFQGGWRALAVLPALLGAALWTAGTGLLVVGGLFVTLGPRRTRLAAQILATFAAAGFMIALQLRRVLPPWAALPDGPPWLAALGRVPLRAFGGDPAALAAWIAGGAILALLAVRVTGRGIAAAVARVEAMPEQPGRSVSARSGVWRTPAAGIVDTRLGPALRRKEWRLLRRDPWLVSQLLLQVLYMLPLTVILANGAAPGVQAAVVGLAPLIVVVSYQVAASVTWLSLSGEGAPELLATAPLRDSVLRGAKLRAVGSLVALLAAGPLCWLAWLSWPAALVTAILSALALRMAMMLGTWHTRPAPRASFAARHRESKLLALIEMVMSMLLGVAAALAVAWSWTALLPLGLAGLVLLINRPPARGGRRFSRSRPSRGAAAAAGGGAGHPA